MNQKRQKKKLTSSLILAFIILFLFSGKVSAQAILATLDGTIADKEGEVLPGVNVTLKNIDSGYVYSTISRSNGRYIISGIQSGEHEIEVRLGGFAPQKRRGIAFSMAASVTINFVLTLATIEEEIIVTAKAPMVEVNKSEVSSIVDRHIIDNLPIGDLSFEGWRSLTVLTPGVQGARSDKMANAQLVAYGEITVDGVSNERTATGRPRAGVPDDSIKEFRVITNLYQAEYGNSSGLVMSALTRSGTNEIKGRLKFLYRDEGLADVNYFVNHATYQGEEIPEGEYEEPPYEHYRYGFFLAGPIKKDKAHFFLAYEGLDNTSYATITAPLAPHETVSVGRGNNQILAKVNYQLNEKNLFVFRYSLDRPTQTNAGVGGMNTQDRSRDLVRNVHDFVASWTNYPTGNTMNELRLQFSSQVGRWSIPDENAYTIRRPGGNFGKASNMVQWSRFLRYQIVDNFSIFHENHHFKVGFDYSHAPWYFYIQSNMPGTFSFRTDEPFDPDDFSTYPYRFAYNTGEPGYDIPYNQLGIFVQDSWKIHPRLNLNIGLRFSYYTLYGYKFDHFNIRNFNPRFGFSWDPVGDGKTAIRGGIGTYSANPSANPATSFKAYEVLESYVMNDPNYPDPFLPNPFTESETVEQTRSIVECKEGLVYPYTFQTSLGFHREVFTDFSIGIDLVRAKGYRLYRRAQLNPVIVGTRNIRVDPTKGNWFLLVDEGKSDYKALYLTLSKRFSKGWSFDIVYTLSVAMTDTESETATPANYEDPENLRMWGPSRHDSQHVLSVISIFNLPFGFQATGLLTYRSATPWNAVYRSDINQDGLNDYVDDYYNSRRGFDSFNINARISKYVNISRLRLHLFVEIYNITNHISWGSIYTRTPSDRFGLPQSAGNPRQYQVGVRLDF